MAELLPGIDYEIDAETGLLVLTAHYLEKRGYCCESGCRNCPWKKEKKGEPDGPPFSNHSK